MCAGSASEPCLGCWGNGEKSSLQGALVLWDLMEGMLESNRYNSRRRELGSVFLEKVTLKGILKLGVGTYLLIQWLRLCTFNAGSVSSVPNQGTKIPHAMWCGQKIFFKLGVIVT